MQSFTSNQFCSSEGLHLGLGVFETFLVRIMGDGAACAVGLSQHLSRLIEGCESIGVPCHQTKAEIVQSISDSLPSVATAGNCYRVRVWATLSGVNISTEPYQNPFENREIKLLPVHAERCLPELKSCSALPSVLARRAAETAGFDEALLIDRRGTVREAAWGNFLWFDRAGTLFAPIKSALPGITRQVILKNWPGEFDESEHTLAEIVEAAEEACITQATAGVVTVSCIGEHDLSGGRMVEQLKTIYLDQVKSPEQLLPKLELTS